MKKILILLLCVPLILQAQSNISAKNIEEITHEETVSLDNSDSTLEEDSKIFEEEKIDPAIDSEDQIKIGEKILFDGSNSRIISLSNYGRPSFSWDFGDDTKPMFGEKISHLYENPGLYTIKLRVKQGQKKESITKNILVYSKKGILVSDDVERFSEIQKLAAEKGIWLKKVLYEGEKTGFSVEEEFVRKFQENIEFIRESNLVVFAAKSISGLQSFAQFWKKLSEEKKFDLTQKLWVKISEENIGKMAKLSQPFFEILKPNYILLTRKEALSPIFEKTESTDIAPRLERRGIEYKIVDLRSRTSNILPFSKLTSYFVMKGISQNIIYLLLSVPFLAFVVCFLRQFVGISTFGVFAPLMLSLSFVVLGLKFGMIVFLIVLLVSYIIRTIFERVELLYIPKISLLLSFLSLSFFGVLGFAVYFDSSLNLGLTIFPMMVMSTISEKFLTSQSSEGFKNAIFSTIETVIVALLAYFFVEWEMLKNSVLAMPEWVLLPILGNIWLGKFTGLRISEYFKFRAFLREDTQE